MTPTDCHCIASHSSGHTRLLAATLASHVSPITRAVCGHIPSHKCNPLGFSAVDRATTALLATAAAAALLAWHRRRRFNFAAPPSDQVPGVAASSVEEGCGADSPRLPSSNEPLMLPPSASFPRATGGSASQRIIDQVFRAIGRASSGSQVGRSGREVSSEQPAHCRRGVHSRNVALSNALSAGPSTAGHEKTAGLTSPGAAGQVSSSTVPGATAHMPSGTSPVSAAGHLPVSDAVEVRAAAAVAVSVDEEGSRSVDSFDVAPGEEKSSYYMMDVQRRKSPVHPAQAVNPEVRGRVRIFLTF